MQAEYNQLRDEEKSSFWCEHIEKWMSSRATQAQYCREQKLSKSKFNYWKRKLYPSN